MERRRKSLYSTRLGPIGYDFHTTKDLLSSLLKMQHIQIWCKEEIYCLFQKKAPFENSFENRLWYLFFSFILFLSLFFNRKFFIFIFFPLFLSNKPPLFYQFLTTFTPSTSYLPSKQNITK